MHTGVIAETNPKNGSISTYGHDVTLTFHLLTPKPNQFTFVPRYINDKSEAKIHQRTPQIQQKPTSWMDAWSHGQTDYMKT